ncbi:MAG: tetratricopeptide repeat protein [Elusimicrobiales bacterium]|nr:tetratricopeptide repeat protein [Elusimicrobiales bacterium]
MRALTASAVAPLLGAALFFSPPAWAGAESAAARAKAALLAGNYAGAAELFGKAAAAGDPEGDVGLGFLLHSGLGVPKEPAKAFAHYSKAAAKKYPKGLYYLGRAYKTSAAGRPDHARAMALFREAAAAGYAPALEAVGVLYKKGQGVKASNARALEWLGKAEKRGLETVYTHLGDIYLEQNKDRKAFYYFSLAVKKGEAQAANSLGYMYATGRGVVKDHEQALKWYRLSARLGFAMAQYNLGDAYYAGAGVSADYAAAYKWLYISELTKEPTNSNNGMALQRLPAVAAKLAPSEMERLEKEARAEYLTCKANHDAWSAERFCRDESPFLPSN